MSPATRAPRGSVTAFWLMLEMRDVRELFMVDGHATMLAMSIEVAIRKIVREELATRLPPANVAREVVELPRRPGEVERHYPVREVARLLGMSRDWVYDRIDDGTFVVANFGTGKSKRRIPASSINAYLKAHTNSAATRI